MPWIYDTSGGALNEEQAKNNANIIINTYRNAGWEDRAIAGLLGNIENESGFNPLREEVGGEGYGLVQWTPKSVLENHCNTLGLSPYTDGDNQLLIRTTEGQEWFYKLSNNEKNLLMMLWNWCSYDNMSVYLGTVRRKEVGLVLSIGSRHITAILSSLCANNYIKRIGRDDFLVNPAYMFKCSVGKIREKIKKYEEYVL